MILWKQSFYGSLTSHLIALQGELEKIELVSEMDLDLHVSWTSPTKLHNKGTKICNARNIIFPYLNNYNMYSVKKCASKHVFYFVKYMDNRHNEKHWFEYHIERQFFKSQSHVTECRNDTHHPKYHSWLDAYELCRSVGTNLPQFYSRPEEEELIGILKISKDIFPLQALFLGQNKVENTVSLTHLQACKISFL